MRIIATLAALSAILAAVSIASGCRNVRALNNPTVNVSMFNWRSAGSQGANVGTNGVSNTTEGGGAAAVPIAPSGNATGTATQAPRAPAPATTTTNRLPRSITV